MKILYLSQVLPYPMDAGPKIRSYYVLRHLAQKHDVTMACFVRPNDPPWGVAHLREFCQRVLTVPMERSRARDALALVRSLLTRQSFIIRRDGRAAMRQCLRGLVSAGDYDAVHADQLWMAQYARYARQVGGEAFHARLVLDQHNAVHLIARRLARDARYPLFRRFLQLESHRLAHYEVETCQAFDHVVWVTHQDYEAVRGMQNAESSHAETQPVITDTVVPICVEPTIESPGRKVPREPVVLFVGGMNWPPNAEGMRWFAAEIWPLVREQVPNARLTVVGKNPPQEILSVAGLEAPGYVKDLAALWAGSRAFIVPLRAGGGMRVKILDAWNHRLPIVSTTIGAEGINYTDGVDIAVADQPQAFAERIIQLLKDDHIYRGLAEGGRATLEAHYDWRIIYRAWDQVYPPTING